MGYCISFNCSDSHVHNRECYALAATWILLLCDNVCFTTETTNIIGEVPSDIYCDYYEALKCSLPAFICILFSFAGPDISSDDSHEIYQSIECFTDSVHVTLTALSSQLLMYTFSTEACCTTPNGTQVYTVNPEMLARH